MSKTTAELTCPACNGVWFNQLEVGKFDSNRLDFIALLTPFESKVVYVCQSCGYGIDSPEDPDKITVIVCGNSDGYRRRVQRKLAPGLEETFEQYLFLPSVNCLLVCKEVWEKNPVIVADFLSRKLVEVVDVSDGDVSKLKDVK